MLLFVLWCLLLYFYWPLAVAVLLLYPLFWAISLPLRVLALVIEVIYATVMAVLWLPYRIVRLLG